MVFPYFFLHRECNWINTLIVILGAILLLNSYDIVFDVTGEILNKDYETAAMGGYDFREVNRLRVLAQMVPAILFLIMHLFSTREFGFMNCSLNILTLNAAIAIAAMNSPYLSRFNMFIQPFMLLAYSDLFKKFSPGIRKIIIAVMILLYAVMQLYECHKSYALNRFQWIWNAP